MLFVFFQAEDGIRDIGVTGVQTCALPIWSTTSTRKSSIAMYSSSSAGRAMRWISSMNSTSPGARFESIAARSPDRSIAAPLGALQHEVELPGDLGLADEVGERVRAQRGLDDPLLVPGRGRHRVVAVE